MSISTLIPGLGTLEAELGTTLTPTQNSTPSNKNSTPSKAGTIINKNSANEIKFLKFVKDNPKFKKLTPEQKQELMGKVYDKHVAPWYQKQLAASGAPKSV